MQIIKWTFEDQQNLYSELNRMSKAAHVISMLEASTFKFFYDIELNGFFNK